MAGNVLLEADAVDFLGGDRSIQAQAGATLNVRPLDPTQVVAVGSAAGSMTDAFQFGTVQADALGDGFASIEIGHVGRSALLVFSGQADFRDPLTLWGSQVQMAGHSVLRSTAAVTLAAGNGAAVGRIEAPGQKVTVRSEQAGSAVTSSAPAGQANIIAGEVVIEALGPRLGQGQALRVHSDQVEVLSPTGMVGRQAQVNGDVHLTVMVDGRTHLQAIVDPAHRLVQATTQTVLPGGSSTQGTVVVSSDRIDQSTFLLPALAQPPAWGGSLFPTQERGERRIDALAALPSSAGAAVEGLGTSHILWAMPDEPPEVSAQELRTAYALGLPAAQPLYAGTLASPAGTFDYWVESLTL
jgi:hypothetical protein